MQSNDVQRMMLDFTGCTLSGGHGRGGAKGAGEEGSASANQLGCMPLSKALQLQEEQVALMPAHHHCIPPHLLHCPHLQGAMKNG